MPVFGRPVRFVLIGIWNTIFGYAAFAALYPVSTSVGLHYLWAMAFGHILAIVNAYVGHSFFVFGREAPIVRSFLRFTLVYWVLFAVNVVLLPLAVEIGGIHPLLAQALVMLLCAVSAFVAHRRFSFSGPSLGRVRPARDGN